MTTPRQKTYLALRRRMIQVAKKLERQRDEYAAHADTPGWVGSKMQALARRSESAAKLVREALRD